MFNAWQQGWDPYAASTPSVYKFNPSKFYAEQLPLGNDTVGGPPRAGAVAPRDFWTQWFAPFVVLAFALYAIQKGALRGRYAVSASAGVGK